MHTHPSTSTNALFLLLLLLLLLLLQTTAGGEIKHQPQPSATRKDVASICDCCEEDEEGLLFQKQPRAPAIATAERCGGARSFPRTETNLDREDRTGERSQPLRTPAASTATPSGLRKFSPPRTRGEMCS
uniref:Secreted protein n=1 Tax=Pipistrellus kuhlii TaxID=59472 RepID=A0A7J7TLF8_PIPKU|nr:hypothetical protein mPipKuh1_009342 [Pipistrellus kuhlii]